MLKIQNDNILLTRGDALGVPYEFFDADDVPYVFAAGDTAVLSVRAAPKRAGETAPPLISVTYNPVAKEFPFTAGDTDPLEYGDYCYDVQFTASGGGPVTTTYGTLTLTYEVT